jgi:hypothetical protein
VDTLSSSWQDVARTAIAGSPHFAHFLEKFTRLDSVYIALEDCGAALATFNIRGVAGRALATLVHRDIWAGALPVLVASNCATLTLPRTTSSSATPTLEDTRN